MEAQIDRDRPCETNLPPCHTRTHAKSFARDTIMAKKKSRSKEPKQNAGWTDDSALGNNPFAKLAVSKDALPKGTPAAPPQNSPPKDAAPSAPARAVVRTERKGRGGKTATIVSHLELPADQLETWCAELRKKLGVGGSVEGDTIVIQGDQRERLADLLVAKGVRKVTRG